MTNLKCPPDYTLDELLAECDASKHLPPKDEEWLDSSSVGGELV